MSELAVAAANVFCAIKAIRATRLLFSALWLGCTSILLADVLFVLEAHELAVLELSIGVSLNLTGERTLESSRALPRLLAPGMAGLWVHARRAWWTLVCRQEWQCYS